jgi:signal transduction histidine kinase
VWTALAEEQAIRLTIDAPRPMHARTVPGAVAQVLDNLLANALDAAPPGTAIDVRVDRNDGMVELRVVDHGPGMSAEARERVFDRFWRGPGAGAGGSCLGLAIVAQLVTASGGDASLRAGSEHGGSKRVFASSRPTRSRTSVRVTMVRPVREKLPIANPPYRVS